jgi:Flp pilus assembly protein TadD
MRKNIEFKTQKLQTDGSVIDDAAGENQSHAAQIFENGFTLLMDEYFVEALPYLARAVNLVGDNAKYRAYYGRALAENDKKHQAEAELQAAIRLDAENPDYRLMLIKLFIKIGLLKRAEGEINRLLEIAPDNYEAQTLLDSLATNR